LLDDRTADLVVRGAIDRGVRRDGARPAIRSQSGIPGSSGHPPSPRTTPKAKDPAYHNGSSKLGREFQAVRAVRGTTRDDRVPPAPQPLEASRTIGFARHQRLAAIQRLSADFAGVVHPINPRRAAGSLPTSARHVVPGRGARGRYRARQCSLAPRPPR
jgi:hypothetical protein